MGQLPSAPAQLRDAVPQGRYGRQNARRSDGASRGCERERVHDDEPGDPVGGETVARNCSNARKCSNRLSSTFKDGLDPSGAVIHVHKTASLSPISHSGVVKPEAAVAQMEREAAAAAGSAGTTRPMGPPSDNTESSPTRSQPIAASEPKRAVPRRFHGTARIDATRLFVRCGPDRQCGGTTS